MTPDLDWIFAVFRPSCKTEARFERAYGADLSMPHLGDDRVAPLIGGSLSAMLTVRKLRRAGQYKRKYRLVFNTQTLHASS